jgi:hypothetical protein
MLDSRRALDLAFARRDRGQHDSERQIRSARGVDSTPMAAVTPGRQRSERFINSLTGPTNALREFGYAGLQIEVRSGTGPAEPLPKGGEFALLGIDVLDAFQTAAVVAAVAAMFASMGSVSAERRSNPLR